MDFTKHTLDELVDALLKCRDRKEAIQNEAKDRVAKLEEIMQALEGELWTRKEKDGLDKIPGTNATVYWVHNKSVKVTDWGKFFEYAKNYPEMITKAPAKKAVVEAFEEGIEVPGVKIDGIISMNVRRKNSKE